MPSYYMTLWLYAATHLLEKITCSRAFWCSFPFFLFSFSLSLWSMLLDVIGFAVEHFCVSIFPTCHTTALHVYGSVNKQHMCYIPHASNQHSRTLEPIVNKQTVWTD